MSLGFTSSIEPIIPSIRMRGLLSFSVPTPRIRSVAPSEPGCPEPWLTDKPALSPASEADTLVMGRDTAWSSKFIEDTAPVTFTFFCVPYPTTTTSSSIATSSRRVTFITLRPFTVIFCVANPIKEKRRVEFLSGTVILYLPSWSVIVPEAVFSTATVIPGNGSFIASVTTPLTVTCAPAVKDITPKNNNNRNCFISNRFFKVLFFTFCLLVI